MALCLVCEKTLPPSDQEAYEAVFRLPGFEGYTPQTLGVVCVLCTVKEEDPNARHQGSDRVHVHLLFDGELN
jgi:hypothetical protein